MEVNAVSLPPVPALQPPTLPPADPNVEETPPAPPDDTEIPQPSATEPLPDEQNEDNAENVKGVIRLLQEGHFKGVADVRLRISHFEELSAIEQGQFQAAAAENNTSLTEPITTNISTLLESGQLTQEQSDNLLQTFDQEVNLSIGDFLAGQIPSTDVLVTELESAFEALVASLTLALSESVTETPEDQPPTPGDELTEETNPVTLTGEQTQENEQTDSTPEPEPTPQLTPEFQTFLENLRSAFTAAMDNFINSINDVDVLPELSEPNGNGGAYDKFLAIYNELYSPQTPDDTPNHETLDIIT